jgi:hypothetical protein
MKFKFFIYLPHLVLACSLQQDHSNCIEPRLCSNGWPSQRDRCVYGQMLGWSPPLHLRHPTADLLRRLSSRQHALDVCTPCILLPEPQLPTHCDTVPTTRFHDRNMTCICLIFFVPNADPLLSLSVVCKMALNGVNVIQAREKW